MNTSEISFSHKCNLHIISIALFSLVARVTGINNLMEYCEKIISDRLEEMPQILPPLIDPMQKSDKNVSSLTQVLIDKVSKTFTFHNNSNSFTFLPYSLLYRLP